MHELALMEELRRLAEAAARAEGAEEITALHLRIGRQAGVDPGALRLAWDVVRLGSSAEAATLELEIVPTRCSCPDCNQDFTAEDLIHACPHCGAIASRILAGRELELVALEVR